MRGEKRKEQIQTMQQHSKKSKNINNEPQLSIQSPKTADDFFKILRSKGSIDKNLLKEFLKKGPKSEIREIFERVESNFKFLVNDESLNEKSTKREEIEKVVELVVEINDEKMAEVREIKKKLGLESEQSLSKIGNRLRENKKILSKEELDCMYNYLDANIYLMEDIKGRKITIGLFTETKKITIPLLLEHLLEGADINIKDNNGSVPIHLFPSDAPILLKFLVENKPLRERVEWNARSDSGLTLASLAIFEDDMSLLKYITTNPFLRSKLKWNIRYDLTTSNDLMPVHLLVRLDKFDKIKFFFETDALDLVLPYLYSLDGEGKTMLQVPINGETNKIVDYLINLNYNPLIGKVRDLKEYKEKWRDAILNNDPSLVKGKCEGLNQLNEKFIRNINNINKILGDLIKNPEKIDEYANEIDFVMKILYTYDDFYVPLMEKFITNETIIKLGLFLDNIFNNIYRKKIKQNPEGNKKANKMLLKAGERGSASLLFKALIQGAQLNTKSDCDETILYSIIWQDHFFMLPLLFDTEAFNFIKSTVYSLNTSGYTIMGIAIYRFINEFDPYSQDSLRKVLGYLVGVVNYNPLIGKIKGLEDYLEDYKEKWRDAILNNDPSLVKGKCEGLNQLNERFIRNINNINEILEDLIKNPEKIEEYINEIDFVIKVLYSGEKPYEPLKEQFKRLKVDKSLDQLINKVFAIHKKKIEQNPEGNKKANKMLLKAGYSGSISMFLNALQNGADIDTRAEGGRVFFQFMVTDVYLIKFLFEKKVFDFVDFYALDAYGETILGEAVRNNRSDLINYLMEIGYNPLIGKIEGLEDYKEKWIKAIRNSNNLEQLIDNLKASGINTNREFLLLSLKHPDPAQILVENCHGAFLDALAF